MVHCIPTKHHEINRKSNWGNCQRDHLYCWFIPHDILIVWIYIYIIRLSRVSLPYKAAPASGPAMYMPQAQPQPGNAKDQSEWDLFWGWWFPLINTASYSFWCVWCVSIGHSPNSKPVLSIHLSIYQSINLSMYPSICLSYPILSYPISFPILSYLYLPIYLYMATSQNVKPRSIPWTHRPIHTPDPYQNPSDPDRSIRLDHRGPIHSRILTQLQIYIYIYICLSIYLI